VAKAQQYVADLAAAGRYHFSALEMAKALGVSRNAVRLSLREGSTSLFRPSTGASAVFRRTNFSPR